MIIFLVTGAGILFAVSNMNAMNDTLDTQVAINEQANNIERAQMNKQRGIYMYVLGNKESAMNLIEDGEEIIEESQERLSELLTDPELLALLNGELEDLEEGVEAVIEEMMEVADSDDPNKNTLLATRFSDLDAGITILNQRFEEFREVTDENVESAMSAAHANGIEVFYITVAGIIIALISSNAIAFYMGNRISKPVKQLSQAAHNTSLGNFDQELEIKTGDEIEELGESFNRMLNSFKLMDAMNKGSLGDETE